MESNTKFVLNQFIMIPLEGEAFVESYKKFCEYLNEQKPQNYDERLLQKPTKLHMSVVIKHLNPGTIDKTKEILTALQPDLKSIASNDLTFKFERFNYLGNDEQHCRVIYAEMKKDENADKLNFMIDLIIKKLIEEGILEKNELESLHVQCKNGSYSILLHLTLLNITFLNKTIKKKQKTFDGEDIITQIESLTLEDCPINKINLCNLREDKSTEKYEVIQSYDL